MEKLKKTKGLRRPLPARDSLLDTPEDVKRELRRVRDEVAEFTIEAHRRLEALLSEYGVTVEGPDKWYFLALKLAMKYEPTFQPPKTGAPPKWANPMRLLLLWYYVEKLRRRRSLGSDRAICDHLAIQPQGKRLRKLKNGKFASRGSLYDAFQLTKSDVTCLFHQRVSERIGWDAFESNFESYGMLQALEDDSEKGLMAMSDLGVQLDAGRRYADHGSGCQDDDSADAPAK